jgi:DNA-binding CsgD family transcriptional regulator
MKDDIINSSLKKSSQKFFFICFAGVFFGLLHGTWYSFQQGFEFVYWLNITSIIAITFLITAFLLKRINLQLACIIFIYSITLNIILINIYIISFFQLDHISYYFLLYVLVLTTGLINKRIHIYVLNVLHLVFIGIIFSLSENNYIIDNIIIFVLAFIGFSYGVILYMKILKESLKKKILLQQNLDKKDRKILIKNNELIKEKALYLEDLVKQKDRELTTNAMIIAQNCECNNKLLQKLKELKLYDNDILQNKLLEIISDLSLRKRSDIWDEFQKRFEEVHQEFYNNISVNYPSLSPAELRLAAFIKLDLSSKEIAMLTQNAKESIEVARSRLRKKLELKQSENLVSFLQKI